MQLNLPKTNRANKMLLKDLQEFRVEMEEYFKKEEDALQLSKKAFLDRLKETIKKSEEEKLENFGVKSIKRDKRII